jgi:hypothetical protein
MRRFDQNNWMESSQRVDGISQDREASRRSGKNEITRISLRFMVNLSPDPS